MCKTNANGQVLSGYTPILNWIPVCRGTGVFVFYLMFIFPFPSIYGLSSLRRIGGCSWCTWLKRFHVKVCVFQRRLGADNPVVLSKSSDCTIWVSLCNNKFLTGKQLSRRERTVKKYQNQNWHKMVKYARKTIVLDFEKNRNAAA